MPIARLSQALTGLFLIIVLAVMAAMSVTELSGPQSTFTFAGLTLFADTSMIDGFSNALTALGAGPTGVYLWSALVAIFDMAAAGLLLFGLLFWFFGEEEERFQAGQLATGAAVSVLAATMVITLPSLAAGMVGTYLAIHVVVVFALHYLAAGIIRDQLTDPTRSSLSPELERDRAISAFAARSARGTAMTAELFDLSGRRQQP